MRAELIKLLVAPRAGEVVARRWARAGFLEPILGGVGYPGASSRLVAIEAARGRRPDPILRLAALSVAIEEDAERLRDRLRLSNAEAGRLRSAAAALIALHGIEAPPSFQGLRTLLFTAGREAAGDALALAHAEAQASPSDEAFAAAGRFLADAPEPRLPIGGADLIARGVAAGRPVGRALRTFQALWIRAGFPKEPEALARLIEQAVAQSARPETSGPGRDV